MTNFETIRASVQASNLPSTEKNELIDVFADIEDQSLIDIAALFKKNSEWVEKINENRKNKKLALESGNTKLWEEILEQEEKYFEDLTFKLD